MARADSGNSIQVADVDLIDLINALEPVLTRTHAITLIAEGISGDVGDSVELLAQECEDAVTAVKGTIDNLRKGGKLSPSPEDPAELARLSVHDLVVFIDGARAANDAWNSIYNQPRCTGKKIERPINGELQRLHRIEDRALDELDRRKIPENEHEAAEYAEAIIKWRAREGDWNLIAALADQVSLKKEDDPATPAAGKTMINEEVREVDIESEVMDVVRSVSLASDVLDETLAFEHSERLGTTHHRYLLGSEQVENALFTLTVARRAVAELEAKYYGEAHGAIKPQLRAERREKAALAS